jgi:hypothetical protein
VGILEKKGDQIMKERKLKVIYIGDKVTSKGTMSSVFLHGKKELSFSNISYHRIGTTYLLNQTSEGMYRFPKYGLEEAPKQIEVSPKQLKDWERDHDIAKNEAQMIRERKKIKNKSDWLDCMEPIFTEYFNSSATRKAAIELAILKELRDYWPNKK